MNEQLVTVIRLANERGATDTEIARVTGYTVGYIHNLRKAAGIRSSVSWTQASVEKLDMIVQRLESGATLQEIGDSLGVTRERVRQLAAKRRITGQVGLSKRKSIREEKFLRERDARYQGTYGCSYGEVIALNEGIPLSHPHSKTLGYRMWVRNVLGTMRSTGTLNFPQWCEAWGDHWKDRGRGNSYRISRIDRTKPFTPDNVICEPGNTSMSRHRKLNPWQTGSRA